MYQVQLDTVKFTMIILRESISGYMGSEYGIL